MRVVVEVEPLDRRSASFQDHLNNFIDIVRTRLSMTRAQKPNTTLFKAHFGFHYTFLKALRLVLQSQFIVIPVEDTFYERPLFFQNLWLKKRVFKTLDRHEEWSLRIGSRTQESQFKYEEITDEEEILKIVRKSLEKEITSLEDLEMFISLPTSRIEIPLGDRIKFTADCTKMVDGAYVLHGFFTADASNPTLLREALSRQDFGKNTDLLKRVCNITHPVHSKIVSCIGMNHTHLFLELVNHRVVNQDQEKEIEQVLTYDVIRWPFPPRKILDLNKKDDLEEYKTFLKELPDDVDRKSNHPPITTENLRWEDYSENDYSDAGSDDE